MSVPDGPGSATADHPFESRDEPVGAPGGGKDAAAGWVYVELPPNPFLCKHCGLAEAAHTSSATPYRVPS